MAAIYYTVVGLENKKEKRQLFNLIFENSREYGNFENGVTPPPT